MIQHTKAFETVADKQVIEALRRAKTSAEAVRARLHEPLAIVGVGCRFPQAKDPDAFWSLLKEGRNAVTATPQERSQPTTFAATRTTHNCPGAFVESVDQFDAAFFGIAGREAASLDPQQRLLLEVAWETLEDAGLDPHQLKDSRTGVFVGICSSDYANRLGANQQSDIDPYWSTGNAHGVAAGRLSYFMDWRGPSAAFDTACSSSLTALHFATRSLRYGDCNLALVAGVNLMLAPELTIAFDQSGMLSPTGACHTFAAAADGFVRGEGCGAVLLKRLSHAIADSNRIYCVVRGTALNQDGRSIGLTAPNGVSQQSVIRRALADASVTPHEVDYVEAHGTGTPLGDPIEVGALSAVFGADGERNKPLQVGSVKTNVGHLEAAAGIAGLIKVCLALEHEAVPPHLHFDEPSPHIDWTPPLEVPSSLTPWPRGERPRIAGLSSFGFGGTNAHAVLEEAPTRPPAEVGETNPQLLTLSAKTPDALRELASRYAHAMARQDSLVDICNTAKVGRAHFDCRLAISANSIDDLTEKCSSFAAHGSADDIVTGTVNPDLHVGLLFPGSADGIAVDQLRSFPDDFRVAFERYVELFAELETSLAETLQHSRAWWQSIDALPTLFCLQLAAADLWQSWGIAPRYVAACGFGEYAAACASGVFPVDSAAQLVSHHVDWLRSAGRSTQARDAFAATIAATSFLPPRYETTRPVGDRADVGAWTTSEYWLVQLQRLCNWTPSTLQLRPRDGTIGIRLGLGFALVKSVEEAGWNGGTDHSGLLPCLAQLYVAGAALDWRAIEPVRRPIVKLPTYPFQRKRHWYAEESSSVRPGGGINRLLGHRLDIGGCETIFESDLAQVPYLTDHRIGPTMVLPMSGFMELALSAGFQVADQLLQVDNLVIKRAIAPAQTQRIQTVISPVDNGFACEIMARDDDGWRTRATCRLLPARTSLEASSELSIRNANEQFIEPATLYQRYREFGLHHGPAFQKLNRLWAGDGEAWGEVVAEQATTDAYLMHPTVLDACLQVVGGALNSSRQRAWLPVRLAHYRISSARMPDVLRVHAQVRDQSDEDSLHVDLTVLDEQDEVFAVVTGLMLEPVMSRSVGQSEVASPAAVRDTQWVQQMWNQPQEQRAATLDDYLVGCVADVMGLAAEDIRDDKPLSELGLDSMMAYELKQEMQASLGLQVPLEEFLQDRTLREWNHRLLALLEESAQSADHSSTVISVKPINSDVVEGAI